MPPQNVVRDFAPDVGNKVGMCFIALLFPMIPVYMLRGVNGDLFLNIILWLFAILPGTVHAWYIIIKYTPHHPDPNAPVPNVERKYAIEDPANPPEPLPDAQLRHSRDGSEIQPFTVPKVEGEPAREGQLPSYESVAGGSDGSVRPSGGRADSKGR